MAFSERIVGFGKAPEFATGWRRFQDHAFKVRLEGRIGKANIEGAEKELQSATRLLFCLGLKNMENKPNDIAKGSKLKCTFFLGIPKSGEFEEYATEETVVGECSMGASKEQVSHLVLCSTKKRVEDIIRDPEQDIYDADADILEIAALLRVFPIEQSDG